MSVRPSSCGRRRAFGLGCVALALFGCARQESPPLGENGPSASDEDPAATIQVLVVDRAEFDAVLAEQRGNVVLVDFWARWCAPCVQQLPHTFEMAAQRRAEGLAVVTVCMEDPDDLEQIQQFLASRGGGAEAINLLSGEGGGSRAMEAFEITGGALPHYRLYDRQLQLRQTFALDPSAVEQFTSDDVESAVDALLEE